MSQNIINIETRVAKWQKYRQQIKDEAVLLQKINAKNKCIERLEKKIIVIDSSIIIKKDTYDHLTLIPMKKNDEVEIITQGLNNISSKFDDKSIKEILKLFNKNHKKIVSPVVNNVMEFENLFNEDALSRELEVIGKAVDDVDKEHDGKRVKLRQNKNLITNIISHDISSKKKTHINLYMDCSIYKDKLSPKKIIIILIFLVGLFLILTIIFITLWFGGV